MVKTSMSSTKYVIYGDFSCQGYIDKPDLIGAFFGQTEGLIGENLEFQNLQKTGKIGRIDIKLNKSNSKTKGSFVIPTSLDKVEVSLVAAAIESIEKIGHTSGVIKITLIKDEREEKRKLVMLRAEELLSKLKEDLPNSNEISSNIINNISKKSIKKYGKEIYGGPTVKEDKSIILVEGRADVLNLLENGINNVVSFNGSNKLVSSVINLVKNKEIILFLDDDKAGKSEFEVLTEKLDVDYYVYAPSGKEVEELSYKEIIKCLKNKISLNDDENLEEDNKLDVAIDKIKNIIETRDEIANNIKNSSFIKEIKLGIKKLKTPKEVSGEKEDKNLQENIEEDKSCNHFNQKEFEKIDYLISKVEKNETYILLNHTFRQIKVGPISELIKLKTDKGRVLIFDGVCEKSILKIIKENNLELIICRSKSRIKVDDSIKIKLFKDFN